MQRPQLGTTVSVVVKNRAPKPVYVSVWDAFTPTPPDTITYTGTVAQPDKWLKEHEFNLTTGDSKFPVRTISLHNVVSIDGAVNDQKTNVKVVSVQGSKGNVYQVVINNGVAESCTCPGFQFHRGQCKHLQLALKK